MRRNSLAHAARGADAVLFFQVRAGQHGAEKFHSALIPQAGETSRKWRESVALGADVAALMPVLGSRVEARVAIAWDWESFWAQDLDWRPSVDLDHRERIEAFYSALWRRGVTVDFVHPAADLSGYDVVFAPSLYLIEDDAARNLREYTAQGGTLAFSYFSGIVSTNDNVPAGPYPGQLRDLLGLVIEEFLPLRAGEQVAHSDGSRGRVWSDDIELRGATSVSTFADGPGAGGPAVTRNTFGDGAAWYVATALDGADLDAYVTRVLNGAGVSYSPIGHIETVVRRSEGVDYVFQINHGTEEAGAGVSGRDLLSGDPVEMDQPVPAGSVRVVAVRDEQS